MSRTRLTRLPLSKRADGLEKEHPVPPETFWAVSPGINWSWYALLQPEDEGFRILKYDRLHHGEGVHPRTRTSITLIEDKERNVTGVRLSGEHSTNLKVAPVTNPGHVFGYPHITFKDEGSFGKENEASMKSPLSKRAASGHAVGDKIRLKGHGNIQFKVVSVEQLEDELYYKVEPIHAIYGVSADMVAEVRHNEKKPILGSTLVPLSKRADEMTVQGGIMECDTLSSNTVKVPSLLMVGR